MLRQLTPSHLASHADNQLSGQGAGGCSLQQRMKYCRTTLSRGSPFSSFSGLSCFHSAAGLRVCLPLRARALHNRGGRAAGAAAAAALSL